MNFKAQLLQLGLLSPPLRVRSPTPALIELSPAREGKPHYPWGRVCVCECNMGPLKQELRGPRVRGEEKED